MEEIALWLKETFGLSDDQCEVIQKPEFLPILNIIKHFTFQNQETIKELSALLAFYKEAINAQPNPIFIKNDELRFVFLNRKYKELFNIDNNDFIGKQITDVEYLSESDKEKYHREDSEMLENSSVIQYETVFNSENNIIDSLYWSKGFVVPETNEKGLIGEIVNISEEKRLQRELYRHAIALEELLKKAEYTSKLDPATQVYNRHILADGLPEMLERMESNSLSVCGILTDIDSFKYINDTYGHVKGDEVILKFSQILKSVVGHNDIVIRIGGDEFMCMLLAKTLDQAKDIAERFRQKVCDEIILPRCEAVTASIGVAEYKSKENILSFISRMDEAMYQAKNSGKNKVKVF